MSRKKKVLIIEPSVIIREGLIQILSKSPELDILYPSDGTEDYTERISISRPDILLINPTLIPYTKRYPVYSLAQEYPHMTSTNTSTAPSYTPTTAHSKSANPPIASPTYSSRPTPPSPIAPSCSTPLADTN